jgi:hypothetical protein
LRRKFTARKLKKQSKGFCGYQWMVESIIDFGEILTAEQRKALIKEKGMAAFT